MKTYNEIQETENIDIIVPEKKPDRHNLKPIRLKTARREIIKKVLESNEVEKKIEEKISNKLILKPIEIRDPRKYHSNNVKKENNQFFNNNNLNATIFESSPYLQKSLEKFSKTSDFNFKIFENLENYNTEISRLEENLNLKPGEIIKNIYMLKNLNFNEVNNISSMKMNNLQMLADAMPKYKLKLEEMITLNIFHSTKTCGIVKKMLHAPSLKIYVVRVILF